MPNIALLSKEEDLTFSTTSMAVEPDMWHSFHRSFSALKHPGYRIFWCGQMVSLIGSWMQSVGQPWLAYTLTKSPLLLGLVGALQFTPTLLLSLFVGAWVDRVSKRRLIIFTQLSLAVFASLYFFLIQSGHLQYWHILVIASFQGVINAIDMPSRHAFMIELVGKERFDECHRSQFYHF